MLLNASRIYNYQVKKAKLCEMIALSLTIFKNIIFIGVGKPDFKEGQVENRAKTGKLPNFPGI